MPLTPDSITMTAARRAGVDPRLLHALFTAESGARQNVNGRPVRSRAGALGRGQLMPATARALGVNPYDEQDNAYGAAKYLRQQLDAFGGDIPKALAAYNAGPGAVRKYGGIPPYQETRKYVERITGLLGGRYGTGATGPTTAPEAAPTDASDPRQEILARLIGRGSLGRAVAAKALATGDVPRVAAAFGGADTHAGAGDVIGAPMDRPGAQTNPGIVDFVRRVAGVYGRPIQLGTGTRHNRFVAGTQRESAHWAGNALDLPASGASLTAMGQAALIAAGMPASIARRQKGGVFNVNGYNILFNTNIGGNHFDHLHVGQRR